MNFRDRLTARIPSAVARYYGQPRSKHALSQGEPRRWQYEREELPAPRRGRKPQHVSIYHRIPCEDCGEMTANRGKVCKRCLE